MPREQLMVSSGSRSWQDGDDFIARFIGVFGAKAGKGGKQFNVLRFETLKAGVVERNVTKAWEDLVGGKSPIIAAGDILHVKAGEERATGKRGQRFRPFDVFRLTTKDIPAGFRNGKK